LSPGLCCKWLIFSSCASFECKRRSKGQEAVHLKEDDNDNFSNHPGSANNKLLFGEENVLHERSAKVLEASAAIIKDFR
ncbi:hypothetical protein CEXT_401121, partial [Caerostris extrusa]